MTPKAFTLEKPVWTDGDFEQMGWHDVRIHAVAFHAEAFELWLDIDYIFRWVKRGKNHFSFWVAPATLVFKNLHSLTLDVESTGGLLILDIARGEPRRPGNDDHIAKQTEWLWRIDCNEGEVTFRSVGYTQFTRRPPVLLPAQQLTLEERGGISFARDYAG